jgi:addiction module HigA family antidote
MDEYQLNAFSLSKALEIDYQMIRRIISGQSKITAPIALRLGKFFGNEADFWMDLQAESDLEAATNDKELMAVVKSIPKAQKPVPKAETQKKYDKKGNLSDKRKKAAKVPGAKSSSRQPVGKKSKKK